MLIHFGIGVIQLGWGGGGLARQVFTACFEYFLCKVYSEFSGVQDC